MELALRERNDNGLALEIQRQRIRTVGDERRLTRGACSLLYSVDHLDGLSVVRSERSLRLALAVTAGLVLSGDGGDVRHSNRCWLGCGRRGNGEWRDLKLRICLLRRYNLRSVGGYG